MVKRKQLCKESHFLEGGAEKSVQKVFENKKQIHFKNCENFRGLNSPILKTQIIYIRMSIEKITLKHYPRKAQNKLNSNETFVINSLKIFVSH